ncbi:SMC5-SMC6 complex localization factor protein 1-like [Ptychodera flava]|uniref:SMC5-SMC6 complex localization factor protein 1-like n=1 Tax=Ptychodera flava TaxID=63121 RepID=UPI003969BB7A
MPWNSVIEMSFKATRKSNCKTQNCKLKFLLSAFPDHEKVQLARQILALGGVYYETQEYKADCTHIVSSKPIRSEKYLCGCAAGKWVVTKEFILDSAKAGKWLDSYQYEWGNKVPTDCNYPIPLLMAPRRWRLLRDGSGRKPFSKWTAMIFVENLKRRPVVYKRLLEAGGATVLPPKFTLQDLDSLAKKLTHVFVDMKYENNVKGFVRRGIPCISPDYIAETLLQDTEPDTGAFVVSSYVSPLLALSSKSSSSGSSQRNSQTSVSTNSSNQKSSSSSSTSLSTSSSSQNSQTTSSSIPNSQTTSTDSLSSRLKLTSSSLTSSAASSQTSSPAGKGTPLHGIAPKSLTEALKITLKAEEEIKSLTPNKTMNDPRGVKRKLLESEDTIRNIVLRVQKKKAEQSGPSFVPYCFQMLPLPKEKTKKCALPFSHTLVNMLEATIEEGMWFAVIGALQSNISSTRYPTPHLMHQLMVEMIKTSDQAVSLGAYHLLKQVLCLHCPTTSPALRLMYLQSLSTTQYSERMEHVSGGEWDFVCSIIRNSLAMETDDVTAGNDNPETEVDMSEENGKKDSQTGVIKYNKSSCKLLLQYLVTLFEQDFLGIVTRQRSSPRKSPTRKTCQTRQCILSCLLWPDGYPGVISTAVVTLLDYLVQAVKLATAESNTTQLVQMVQRMVTIAAECYQQVNVKLDSRSSDDNEKDFAKEIMSAVEEGGILDCHESVSLLLQTTQPVWLRMRLAEVILGSYDNRLVHPDNRALLDKKLSLRKLVSCYFFLLPKTHASTTDGTPVRKADQTNIENQKPGTPRDRKSKRSGALQTLAESNTMLGFKQKDSNKQRPLSPSKRNNNQSKKKVNKRNTRGETPLHIACMRNNLSKVKELLACPGIDVNAKDNAGWTPLHEASNHGNLAIVKELLKFKPAPTIMSFFGKGAKGGKSGKGMTVDLLAAPECGTTPLHDAVFTGHINVARLLVKAGGKAVLMALNAQGYTPLDCAASPEMKDALQLSDPGSQLDCSSQESSSSNSQGTTWGSDSQPASSQTSSQGGSLTADSGHSLENSALSPTDMDYSQALKTPDGRKRCFMKEQCYQYAMLVQHLLKSYLRANDISLFKYELDQSAAALDSLFLSSQDSVTSSDSVNSESFAPCKKRKVEGGKAVVALSDLHDMSKLSSVQDYSETSVADDLLCLTELSAHIKNFERHLMKISPSENLPDHCKKLFLDVDILASQ